MICKKGNVKIRCLKCLKVLALFSVTTGLIIVGAMWASKGPLPYNGFNAALSVEEAPGTLRANSEYFINVKIKNISKTLWPLKAERADGKFTIHLAYHWVDKSGKMVIFDGKRTRLPGDVKPGEEVSLKARVIAPPQAGEYRLEFDMVQEAVAWFKDKGSKTTGLNIKIE